MTAAGETYVGGAGSTLVGTRRFLDGDVEVLTAQLRRQNERVLDIWVKLHPALPWIPFYDMFNEVRLRVLRLTGLPCRKLDHNQDLQYPMCVECTTGKSVLFPEPNAVAGLWMQRRADGVLFQVASGERSGEEVRLKLNVACGRRAPNCARLKADLVVRQEDLADTYIVVAADPECPSAPLITRLLNFYAKKGENFGNPVSENQALSPTVRHEDDEGMANLVPQKSKKRNRDEEDGSDGSDGVKGTDIADLFARVAKPAAVQSPARAPAQRAAEPEESDARLSKKRRKEEDRRTATHTEKDKEDAPPPPPPPQPQPLSASELKWKLALRPIRAVVRETIRANKAVAVDAKMKLLNLSLGKLFKGRNTLVVSAAEASVELARELKDAFVKERNADGASRLAEALLQGVPDRNVDDEAKIASRTHLAYALLRRLVTPTPSVAEAKRALSAAQADPA